MPRYEVMWNKTVIATSIVDATSEEEALKLAEESPDDGWNEWQDTDYFPDWIPVSAELSEDQDDDEE
jgi:hypothetical protein